MAAPEHPPGWLSVDRLLGEHHSGALHLASAQAKAGGIVAAELKRRRWREGDLKRRRKNDPDKLEIGARVALGTWKTANANLHRYLKPSAPRRGGQARRGGGRP